MRAVRQKGTTPEVALRRALHKLGLRFRLQRRVPGRRARTIDIAFPRERIAVFVDGCFWHCCPQHATWPKSNRIWWREKLAANRARDRDTDVRLGEAGWIIVRVWEHEDPEKAAERVQEAVLGRQPH